MTDCKPLKVTLLGATGSIGASTLDVMARHPDRYQIYALTANTNVEVMAQLCETWSPDYAVMYDVLSADKLLAHFKTNAIHTQVLVGEAGLQQVVGHARER